MLKCKICFIFLAIGISTCLVLNGTTIIMCISLDSQKHRFVRQQMLWFRSRKKSGGLINAFLSDLCVLQVETGRSLY